MASKNYQEITVAGRTMTISRQEARLYELLKDAGEHTYDECADAIWPLGEARPTSWRRQVQLLCDRLTATLPHWLVVEDRDFGQALETSNLEGR